MRLFKFFAIVLTLFLFGATCHVCAANLPSVAFYYGSNPPIDELHAFDIVVVDPQTGLDPKKFNDGNSQAYAYVSVGEWHGDKKTPNKKWIVASNRTWNSHVLDQTNPAWREYALNTLIAPLVQQGYKGLFFDTMDSYHLFAKTSADRAKQEAGLVALIKSVKKQYPNIHIILNRGFELLPKVKKDIAGIAAESLYAGWNHDKKQYVTVSKKSREWLMAQMQVVKKIGLWPIVIDYAKPVDREKAQTVADKIKADGFIPWVGNGTLTNLGIGSVTVVPRTVLMIYDSQQFPDIMESSAMRFAAFPLEQKGYIPRLVDVRSPLPNYELKGRVAAVLVWINAQLDKQAKPLVSWMIRQKASHIPIALLGSMDYLKVASNVEKEFGLHFRDIEFSSPYKVYSKTKMMDYETKASLTESTLDVVLKRGKPQLIVQDKSGKKSEVVGITAWGGYALYPFVIQTVGEKQTYWVLNPFAFLTKALQLKQIPVADLTTKNGLRMLMVHIDGDGWATKSEWFKGPIAAQSLLDKILMKYQIPTTASIIEGEVSEKGVYPQFAKQSIQVARDIFKLPWIEIATHTYTHPFKWRELARDKVGKGYNLQIPGYKYSPEREITGSMDYINRVLAPKDKRCKVVLWPGDTNPDEAALAVAYQDGLLNMNGGDTLITENNKTLTAIAPIGIIKGKYIQIYAPNQNENVYTNDWTGPFYGFRNVIETFKLTESPHRYKPIDIYYHTYSASKKASLRALEQVYDWALKQPTNEVFSSEYIKRAMAFYHVVYAHSGKDWLIRHMGALKEYRLPEVWGYPELSDNVMGYNQYDDQTYVHVDGGSAVSIALSKQAPLAPYIKQMNGDVGHFTHDANSMHFSLAANEPIKLVVHGVGACQLIEDKKVIQPVSVHDADYSYAFKRRAVNALTAKCAS
ncbi:MAG: endo alpha-1,4 polygalactosaminidase [Coxiellaceae bacterium]|nr:endo alpha-1,4 polygalactosaminidase [Coxiellaceae bacterium]